jgi:hypothetical protein
VASVFFKKRRELGNINLGRADTVVADGWSHHHEQYDCSHVEPGVHRVAFSSAGTARMDPRLPATVGTPACLDFAVDGLGLTAGRLHHCKGQLYLAAADSLAGAGSMGAGFLGTAATLDDGGLMRLAQFVPADHPAAAGSCSPTARSAGLSRWSASDQTGRAVIAPVSKPLSILIVDKFVIRKM